MASVRLANAFPVQDSFSNVAKQKKPSDSYLKILIPIKTDGDIRAEYVDAHGLLRLGKLFEILDALAGRVLSSTITDMTRRLTTQSGHRLQARGHVLNCVFTSLYTLTDSVYRLGVWDNPPIAIVTAGIESLFMYKEPSPIEDIVMHGRFALAYASYYVVICSL